VKGKRKENELKKLIKMEEIKPMKRVKSPDVLIRKKKAPKRNLSNMVTLNATHNNSRMKATPNAVKQKRSRMKNKSGFDIFNEFSIKKKSKVQKLDKMMKKLTVKFKSKMTFDDKVIAGLQSKIKNLTKKAEGHNLAPKLRLDTIKRTSQRPHNKKLMKISPSKLSKRKSPDSTKNNKVLNKKFSARKLSEKDTGCKMFQSLNQSNDESAISKESNEKSKNSPEFGTSQDSSRKNIKKFKQRSSTLKTNQFEKFQIKISKPDEETSISKFKPRRSKTKITLSPSAMKSRSVPKKSNSSANVRSNSAKGNTLGVVKNMKKKIKKKGSFRPNMNGQEEIKVMKKFKHSLTHTFIDLECFDIEEIEEESSSSSQTSMSSVSQQNTTRGPAMNTLMKEHSAPVRLR